MTARWALLVLVGAVLCTLGDHLHATLGVLAYPHVAFWDQAWWVLPLFGSATVVCVLGARPFLKGRDLGSVAPPARLLADLIGFCAAYAYTSFAAPERPLLTLLVLSVAFVVRVLGDARSPGLVVYSLVLAVGGSLFEAGLSSTGAFHYLHPDLLGVPMWLPGIYLHAGLIAGELSLFMRR